MSIWVLSGTMDNWKLGLEKKVWGVSEKAKGLWNKVEPGDIVVFYATKIGFIGEGMILEKYIDEKPLWPDEKRKTSKYKYRFKIKITKLYSQPKLKPKDFKKIVFAINPITETEYKKILK